MKYFTTASRLDVNDLFPSLTIPIVYPSGETHNSLFEYLKNFNLEDANPTEMLNYLREDFKRFVYTLNLVPVGDGDLLEIGSNPYFTSLLLRKYTNYTLYHTNYFGVGNGKEVQTLHNVNNKEAVTFEYENHNVEASKVPFDKLFDVVLFCEVLEHLIDDPMQAMLNLKNALKPGGILILTTPNVSRIENISKMIAGVNIYDPYSGYGQYGRHNREYNRHELFLFLSHMGFDIEIMFSSDVHPNTCDDYYKTENIVNQINSIKNRNLDLGQYLFVKAKNVRPALEGRPEWLFRSYNNENVDV